MIVQGISKLLLMQGHVRQAFGSHACRPPAQHASCESYQPGSIFYTKCGGERGLFWTTQHQAGPVQVSKKLVKVSSHLTSAATLAKQCFNSKKEKAIQNENTGLPCKLTTLAMRVFSSVTPPWTRSSSPRSSTKLLMALSSFFSSLPRHAEVERRKLMKNKLKTKAGDPTQSGLLLLPSLPSKFHSKGALGFVRSRLRLSLALRTRSTAYQSQM